MLHLGLVGQRRRGGAARGSVRTEVAQPRLGLLLLAAAVDEACGDDGDGDGAEEQLRVLAAAVGGAHVDRELVGDNVEALLLGARSQHEAGTEPVGARDRDAHRIGGHARRRVAHNVGGQRLEGRHLERAVGGPRSVEELLPAERFDGLRRPLRRRTLQDVANRPFRGRREPERKVSLGAGAARDRRRPPAARRRRRRRRARGATSATSGGGAGAAARRASRMQSGGSRCARCASGAAQRRRSRGCGGGGGAAAHEDGAHFDSRRAGRRWAFLASATGGRRRRAAGGGGAGGREVGGARRRGEQRVRRHVPRRRRAAWAGGGGGGGAEGLHEVVELKRGVRGALLQRPHPRVDAAAARRERAARRLRPAARRLARISRQAVAPGGGGAVVLVVVLLLLTAEPAPRERGAEVAAARRIGAVQPSHLPRDESAEQQNRVELQLVLHCQQLVALRRRQQRQRRRHLVPRELMEEDVPLAADEHLEHGAPARIVRRVAQPRHHRHLPPPRHRAAQHVPPPRARGAAGARPPLGPPVEARPLAAREGAHALPHPHEGAQLATRRRDLEPISRAVGARRGRLDDDGEARL